MKVLTMAWDVLGQQSRSLEPFRPGLHHGDGAAPLVRRLRGLKRTSTQLPSSVRSVSSVSAPKGGERKSEVDSHDAGVLPAHDSQQ